MAKCVKNSVSMHRRVSRRVLNTRQGRREQFHIGLAKYRQHVKHLNVRVVLEHTSQEYYESEIISSGISDFSSQLTILYITNSFVKNSFI